MAEHRVSIYSVQIHPKYRPDDPRQFGDFDHGMSYFGDTVAAFLGSLNWKDDSGVVVLAAGDNVRTRKPDIAATLNTGEHGVVSRIYNNQNAELLARRADHREVVRAMIVFRLPPKSTLGLLAVHTPHGRGVKGYLQRALESYLATHYSALKLKLDPVVPSGVLREAAEHDRLLKVRLVAYGSSTDAFEDHLIWGSRDDLGEVELRISPRRLKRLRGQPLLDLLEGRKAADELLVFDGVPFDALKFEIEDETGSRRTVVYGAQDRGHAVSYVIDSDVEIDEDGPTTNSLLEAVTRVLDETEPPAAADSG